MVLSAYVWTDCRALLVIFTFGESSASETLKSGLRFHGLPVFSGTTRWHVPIHQRGLCYLPSSCVRLRTSSATQASCGAVSKSGSGPASYLKDVRLCTSKWQQKKFPQAAQRVLNTKHRPYWQDRFSTSCLTHPEFYEEESVLGPLPKQFL